MAVCAMIICSCLGITLFMTFLTCWYVSRYFVLFFIIYFKKKNFFYCNYQKLSDDFLALFVVFNRPKKFIQGLLKVQPGN